MGGDRRSRSLNRYAASAVAALLLAGCGSTTTTTTTSQGAGGAVQVHVTAPADGSSVSGDHVNVRGTVNPPSASVEITGQPAQVGNGVFTGTAALHGGQNTVDVVASAPGMTPGSTAVTITQKGSGGGHGNSGGGSSGGGVANQQPQSGGGSTSCEGGVSVGPNTTCAFASNVQSAFQSNGPGNITVYSPVTGQTYSMNCSAGSPHVCTGANNATVYLP